MVCRRLGWLREGRGACGDAQSGVWHEAFGLLPLGEPLLEGPRCCHQVKASSKISPLSDISDAAPLLAFIFCSAYSLLPTLRLDGKSGGWFRRFMCGGKRVSHEIDEPISAARKRK